MAAYGIPEVDIARVLGVSKPTLRKHCGTDGRIMRAHAREGREEWPADQVERWPLTKLIPYARNARTHSEDQIKPRRRAR